MVAHSNEALFPAGSRVAFGPGELDEKVGALALRLDQHLTHDRDNPPLVIGVLPEALQLVRDVARRPFSGPVLFEFAVISNLHEGQNGNVLRTTSGEFPAVVGRHVVFLHTRVMSGATMRYLQLHAEHQGALSVAHFALFHQSRSLEGTAAQPDFAAVKLPTNGLFFGYGIPYQDPNRRLILANEGSLHAYDPPIKPLRAA